MTNENLNIILHAFQIAAQVYTDAEKKEQKKVGKVKQCWDGGGGGIYRYTYQLEEKRRFPTNFVQESEHLYISLNITVKATFNLVDLRCTSWSFEGAVSRKAVFLSIHRAGNAETSCSLITWMAAVVWVLIYCWCRETRSISPEAANTETPLKTNLLIWPSVSDTTPLE